MENIYLMYSPKADIYKIGLTVNKVKQREKQLNSPTGSYGDWVEIHSVQVENCRAAETALFKQYDTYRDKDNKEFFNFTEDQAIYALDALIGNDVLYPESPFAREWVNALDYTSNISLVNPKQLKPFQVRPIHIIESHLNSLIEQVEVDGDKIKKPLVIDKDNKVISGNHRWKAALARKISLVPTVRINEEHLNATDIKDIGTMLNSDNEVARPNMEEEVRHELEQKAEAISRVKKVSMLEAYDCLDLAKFQNKLRKTKRSLAQTVRYLKAKLATSLAVKSKKWIDLTAHKANEEMLRVKKECLDQREMHWQSLPYSNQQQALGAMLLSLNKKGIKLGTFFIYRRYQERDHEFNYDVWPLAELKNAGYELTFIEAQQKTIGEE